MHKILIFISLSGVFAFAESPVFEQARRHYERTEYDTALRQLNTLEPKTGAALALMGKAYHGKGDFKAASKVLEKAVATEPENSHYWNWLGKAYGRRAETSSFLRAPFHASRCRKAFEKAVELDPKNLEAIVDLFSYYLEAPGFVGGGAKKAEAMAEKIGQLHEAEHQWALAELATKRKDYRAAEMHIRKAMELEPKRLGRIIDVAKFLADRGRLEESDHEFARAQELAPGAPKVLFAMAQTYVKGNRNLEEARRMLEEYLGSDLTPEDPSRSEAKKLLRKAKTS
jgi:Flp pilus assembly protein TadD